MPFYAFCHAIALGAVAPIVLGVSPGQLPPDALAATREAAEATVVGGTNWLSVLSRPEIRGEFCRAREGLQGLFAGALRDQASRIARGRSYAQAWAAAEVERGQQPVTPETVEALLREDPAVASLGGLAAFSSFNVTRTLYFLLRVLAERPELRGALEAEIRGRGSSVAPSAAELEAMPRLVGTVNAAIAQLLPTGGMPRESMRDTVLKVGERRIAVPQGALLVLNFSSYQPERETVADPQTFDPRAWWKPDRGPVQWGFGHGARACPAQGMVRAVLRMVLWRVLQRNVRVHISRPVPFVTGWGGHGPSVDEARPVQARISTSPEPPVPEATLASAGCPLPTARENRRRDSLGSRAR